MGALVVLDSGGQRKHVYGSKHMVLLDTTTRIVHIPSSYSSRVLHPGCDSCRVPCLIERHLLLHRELAPGTGPRYLSGKVDAEGEVMMMVLMGGRCRCRPLRVRMRAPSGTQTYF